MVAVLKSHALSPWVSQIGWRLFVFPGGEMLPRAGMEAMQHSVHQTAP